MPTIQFVTTDGSITELDADNGSTVMQVALMQGLRGINADCGGACQCATCHVYVDAAWADRLPPLEEQEDAMLDSAAAERKTNSRLSCCITMSDELDGIVVRVPDRQ
jgi:2Fe-2S ferredoxin